MSGVAGLADYRTSHWLCQTDSSRAEASLLLLVRRMRDCRRSRRAVGSQQTDISSGGSHVRRVPRRADASKLSRAAKSVAAERAEPHGATPSGAEPC